MQPARGTTSSVTQCRAGARLGRRPTQRDAVVDVEPAPTPTSQTVQVAVGQKLTRGRPASPTPTAKAALQRGQVATQDWLNDHDVRIDPVFGIAVDDGAVHGRSPTRRRTR